MSPWRLLTLPGPRHVKDAKDKRVVLLMLLPLEPASKVEESGFTQDTGGIGDHRIAPKPVTSLEDAGLQARRETAVDVVVTGDQTEENKERCGCGRRRLPHAARIHTYLATWLPDFLVSWTTWNDKDERDERETRRGRERRRNESREQQKQTEPRAKKIWRRKTSNSRCPPSPTPSKSKHKPPPPPPALSYPYPAEPGTPVGEFGQQQAFFSQRPRSLSQGGQALAAGEGGYGAVGFLPTTVSQYHLQPERRPPTSRSSAPPAPAQVPVVAERHTAFYPLRAPRRRPLCRARADGGVDAVRPLLARTRRQAHRRLSPHQGAPGDPPLHIAVWKRLRRRD
ncbi:hypothetical protein C8R45DRAFT_1084617 [Mycena sanguinolenta]|nr:hypothetical protein C8R45DRAFT_1084617 [Mycena sanguinolenta]